MPRNSSGTYTLPAGNPVVPGTIIETAWANPTLGDVASALTDSLDRLGRGTMLAPLKLFDGTPAAPALSFNAEATTGIYRPGPGVLAVSVLGADVAQFSAAGLSVTGAFSTGPITTTAGGSKLLPDVGIGALAALATLTASLMVTDNAAAFAGAVPIDTVTHVVGADGASARAVVDAVGGNAIFQGRRANGTLALPSAPVADDFLASFGGGAYNGTAWTTALAGAAHLVAAEPFTALANGTYWQWMTTNIGAAVATEKMRLSAGGVLGIGVVPQAWSSSFRVAELNTRGLVLGGGTDSAVITQGVFNDGANWRYSGTTAFGVSSIDFFNGELIYRNAPSGAAAAVATFTERMRMSSVGNFGIGTSAVDSRLTVSANAAAFTGAMPSGTLLHTISADASAGRMVLDVAAANGVIQFRRCNGTIAAPTALLADNTIGAFGGSGYDGTGWSTLVESAFSLRAAENWTNTAHGTYLYFVTTPKGSTAAQERMRLDSAGHLGMGIGPYSWTAPFFGTGVIDFIGGAFIAPNNASPGILLGGNLYNDGSYRYKAAGRGQLLSLNASAGFVDWYGAPAGVGGAVASITSFWGLDMTGATAGCMRIGGHITRAELVSAGAPVTGNTTFPHGGSRVPDSIDVRCRCVVASDGFSPGDESKVVSANFGWYGTATSVVVCNPSQVVIMNAAGSGGINVAGSANYRLVARALWL